MSLLRVYTKKEWEALPCDPWERCPTCGGTGRRPPDGTDSMGLPRWESAHDAALQALIPAPARADYDARRKALLARNAMLRGPEERDNRVAQTCPDCEGHGSARAMALDRGGYRAAAKLIAPYVQTIQGWRSGEEPHPGPVPGYHAVRCEDCGHPMSEGTWERPADVDLTDAPHGKDHGMLIALSLLQDGLEPTGKMTLGVHYSPCDEGCRHGGPGRYKLAHRDGWLTGPDVVPVGFGGVEAREASWRQVDARRLSWDSDLSPEQTAVLCLRCFASRSTLAESREDC